MNDLLTIRKMFEDNRKELRLRIINNKKGFHRKIESVKLNRPGLERIPYIFAIFMMPIPLISK